MKNCPKCGKPAYLKQPGARIIRDPGNFTIANEYVYVCLACKYTSEKVREETKMGKFFSLPWYKRIFKKMETEI